jgi:hypothetical protein
VRERRLVALVAVALVAGVAGGFALARNDGNGGSSIAVGSDGPATTTPPTIGTTLATTPSRQCVEVETINTLGCSPPTVPPQTLPAPGAEQPADTSAARSAVAAAYADAYDGDAPDPRRIAAIEGGAGLVTVFEQLRTGSFAEQVRSARTVVDEIVFVSSTRAAVRFHSVLGDGSISGPYVGDAVLNGNDWQISHESYCQTVIPAGVHCPM